MVEPEVAVDIAPKPNPEPDAAVEDKKDGGFWLPHVESWAKSGVTAKRYCEENNLSRVQFFYWKNKHRKQRGDFIGIKISKKNISGCLCTLEFPNGRRLLIHDVGCLRLLPHILGLAR